MSVLVWFILSCIGSLVRINHVDCAHLRHTGQHQHGHHNDNAESTPLQASFDVSAFQPPRYKWIEVTASADKERWNNSKAALNFALSGTAEVGKDLAPPTEPRLQPAVASHRLIGQRVFVSMATFHERIGNIVPLIRKIFGGTIIPDYMFLFVSEEPFLLDKGIPVPSLPSDLLELTKSYPFSIIYTDNMGPHRKLLPVLSKFWKEDIAVVTLDDEDKEGDDLKTYFPQIIKYYEHSKRNAQVALRARRIGICRASGGGNNTCSTLPYKKWDMMTHGRRGMLLLPTGTGGVLYRPQFMHPIVFDEGLRNVTVTADDVAFRLSAMSTGTAVIVGCAMGTGYSCPQRPKITVYKYPSIWEHDNIDVWMQTLRDRGREFGLTPERVYGFMSGAKRVELHGLFGTFNLKGGNDGSWSHAVEYLRSVGVMDFSELSCKHYKEERKETMAVCL